MKKIQETNPHIDQYIRFEKIKEVPRGVHDVFFDFLGRLSLNINKRLMFKTFIEYIYLYGQKNPQ